MEGYFSLKLPGILCITTELVSICDRPVFLIFIPFPPPDKSIPRSRITSALIKFAIAKAVSPALFDAENLDFLRLFQPTNLQL